MNAFVLVLLLAQLQATVHPHSATLQWVQGTVLQGACTVTSNKIYRGNSSGTETLLATTSGPTTSYSDTTVSAGRTYFYKVSAVNCDGESPLSNEVSATIPHKPAAKKEPPQPPKHLEAKVIPREEPK